ncbi:acyl-CoA thioester hydrolase [Azospirillum fermentarium]|uniref:acyl-CoA thioesterase n=1 Tax=Azospirillum fermentarium TaxID=1233114 RepID=UPI00222768A6|nr:thioesterase family protein [Azospirillum fermentarium]MCW2244938.1 acyl-CoA thioester hydrolase [Azospirillum fermentarium]
MSAVPSAPTDPARYRFWVAEEVRFADLDVQGHVNNNAFGVFFEHGRVEFLRHLDGFGPDKPWLIALARSVIDYRAELHYPASIRIGMGVLRLGNTSLTLGGAVFKGDACISTQEAVCVLLDAGTRRPTPVPDSLRAALSSHSLV